MVQKRGIYHIRKRVPTVLIATIGKREIWKSLRTGSEIEACRRSYAVLAKIESELAHARLELGIIVDLTLFEPWETRSGQSEPTVGSSAFIRRNEKTHSDTITVSELFDRFLADPTQNWSPRTRLAYQTTQRLAVSMFGASTATDLLTRAVCRDFMESLRFLPKRASRAFPSLSPNEASKYAKATGYKDIISASNANTYLNKVCVVLNWAVREEFLNRNHLMGLRLADPVSKMDKRLPFSDTQLEAIFNSPLYTGCQNDELGYAKQGIARPRGTRFWVPVIALYSGMRLNEICQLDVTDVREIDGIECFVASERSMVGSTDKSLKTSTSERVVPVHSFLKRLGLMAFVEQRIQDGHTKLFFDICAGRNGFRSTAFSKWFVLFLEKAGARQPRTSFHSFRHCFRDALRRSRVDREIAMMLGGWGNGTKSGLDVSDYYGSGFDVSVLANEIEKVSFEQIKALPALICSTDK